MSETRAPKGEMDYIDLIDPEQRAKFEGLADWQREAWRELFAIDPKTLRRSLVLDNALVRKCRRAEIRAVFALADRLEDQNADT